MNDHKSSVESFCKEYLAVPTSDLISIDEAGFYSVDGRIMARSERSGLQATNVSLTPGCVIGNS